MITKKVEKSLALLLSWFDRNGDAGFDPYDIKGFNNYMLGLMNDMHKLKKNENDTNKITSHIVYVYDHFGLNRSGGIDLAQSHWL